MLFYAARKAATGLVLAVLVTLITFWLLSFSFEDVVRTILGPSATDETVAAMMQDRGYDRSFLVQYWDWLSSALTGDLGVSVYTSLPVLDSVLQRLAVTLSIIAVALVLSVIISVALGVWAASRGGLADKLSQGISLVGHLIPNLLLAIGLVVIFAVNLKILPATGYTEPGEDLGRWLKAITIPVIVLAIGSIANLTAQVRGAMVDELRKDYVRTLRTRGISRRSIVLKHALRNAGSPALTVLSLVFIGMFGGALIIENVFALPGFGSFAFNASMQGDIPVIMGVAVFGVLLVTIVNLVVDLANGWLNPKARIY
jgi:peptide/nickel transport system permease protein